MKKLLCAVICAVLALTAFLLLRNPADSGAAQADDAIWLTPLPTSMTGVTLAPSDSEVKVFASPNMKANIVGYIIVGGQQQVEVLYQQGDWYCVSFTSVYGVSQGWIPASFFIVSATPTPQQPVTPTPVPSGTGYVINQQTGYRLNLRQEASASSASIGKYYTGTPLTLTGVVRDGFARVAIGTQAGWMDVRYLTTNPYAFISELPVVTVNTPGSSANLRKGPGRDTARIGNYPHGTQITILGVFFDDWYHVAVNGQTGYMSGEVLSQRFPWQYGTDSDHEGVNSSITSTDVLYVHNRMTTDRLHLRRSPSYSGESMGRFYSGTQVEVISYTRTGWAFVRVGQLEGYMDMNYLSTQAPTQYGQVRYVRNGYGTGVNLRLLPTTESELLGFCLNGSAVTVLGDLSDGWCYVQYGTQFGYMTGARLSLN